MLPAILLLALSAVADGPPVPAPAEQPSWHFAAIPLVSYGSDVGLTLGAGLFFYRPVAEHPDELHSASLSASYATRGPRALDGSMGLRRLFKMPLRTALNIHLGDDSRMPYWGEGAQLGGLDVPAGFGTPPPEYRYHDRRVFLSWILRGPILGALGWHVRARWLDVDVAEPSTLLATARPPGYRGGRVALGELGLLFDTRDREVDTRNGIFATAAIFAAPRLDGISDFSFHGYDAALRVYVPLLSWVTLAVRGVYDRKIAGMPGTVPDQSAAVPFFERMLYEGIAYNEGLGGVATIRGIARYRVNGEEKMLANVALRATFFTTHLASKTQDWGADVGVDAGRATQPGYRAIEGAGATLGLRVVWDRALVLRVEMSRAPGGDATTYVSVGEQF